MKDLNTFQKYLAEEFYDDYREGLLSRRSFIRRLAFITDSMAATVTTMNLLGCSPAELPAPTDDIPPAEPASAQLEPVPNAQSPFSVPNRCQYYPPDESISRRQPRLPQRHRRTLCRRTSDSGLARYLGLV